MPSDWLQVPHFNQGRDGRCLPTCARMVLAYLGREVDEPELARLLKTRSFGTPADNIRLLSRLGNADPSMICVAGLTREFHPSSFSKQMLFPIEKLKMPTR